MCTPKSMGAPLKIAYAYSQELLPELIQESGWNPKFLNGETLTDDSIKDAYKARLYGGLLFDAEANQNPIGEFYAIRSGEILERVSLGLRDIAFVGRDHFEEGRDRFPRVVKLGEVPHARTSTKPAELQAWVTPNSELRSLDEIDHNYVIRTEIPNYTAITQQERGKKTLIRPIDYIDPLSYRQEAQRQCAILIEAVHGALPQQLEYNEIGFVVSETGKTLAKNAKRNLGTICTVEQIIVGYEGSLKNPEKKELMERFVNDIEGVHSAIEIESQTRGERRL